MAQGVSGQHPVLSANRTLFSPARTGHGGKCADADGVGNRRLLPLLFLLGSRRQRAPSIPSANHSTYLRDA